MGAEKGGVSALISAGYIYIGLFRENAGMCLIHKIFKMLMSALCLRFDQECDCKNQQTIFSFHPLSINAALITAR